VADERRHEVDDILELPYTMYIPGLLLAVSLFGKLIIVFLLRRGAMGQWGAGGLRLYGVGEGTKERAGEERKGGK
jgi:hypothetical protein